MGAPRGDLLAAVLLLAAASLAAAASNTLADLYPFAALITSKEVPLCSGALVSPRLVVTTAACARSGPAFVYLGYYNFFLDEFRREGRYEIRKVDHVEVHPEFKSSDTNQHNLAVLRLNKPSKHKPVATADASFDYPPNSTAVRALGYGSLSSDGFFPQLHGDDLMLLPEEECGGLQTAYGRWWAATPPDSGPAPQACTGLSHAFRACASGNAGGPLLLPRAAPGGAPLQLGLLTSGFSCSIDRAVASASSPALYTWLPRYADWLAKQVRAAEKAWSGSD
ncbi:hypothetical protein ABPG77_001274 [Micractinium sp. CCAP 211/92]